MVDRITDDRIWYHNVTPGGHHTHSDTSEKIFRWGYAPIETPEQNNNAQIAACESYLSAVRETEKRVKSIWADAEIKLTEDLYQFQVVRPWAGDDYAVGMGRTPKEAWDDVLRSPQFIRDEAIFLSGKAAGVAETYAAFSKGFLKQEQRRELESALEFSEIAAQEWSAVRYFRDSVNALLEETKCPLQLLNTLSREEVESLTGGSR